MTWPAVYNRVFASLRGVVGPTQTGHWEAFCPAHQDEREQSLSITVGRAGQLLLRCHGGEQCSTEKIVQAIGLRMSDLFPDADERRERARDGGAKFVCAYDYRDERGVLLYQVARWLKPDGRKVFSQRRPNPAFKPREPVGSDNHKYVNGVEGVRRVLYRLPEMLAALRKGPDRTVVVIEGEKAVDYCRGLGMIATTNAMGAGKWLPEYSHSLAGRNVVVVPDADEPDEKSGVIPGWEHAKAVTRSLYGLARSVKLLPLPGCRPKWGLDDWLAAQPGDDRDKLKAFVAVANQSPAWTPGPGDYPAGAGFVGAEMGRLATPGDPSAAESLGHVVSAYLAYQAAAAAVVAGDRSALAQMKAAALRLAAYAAMSIPEMRSHLGEFGPPPEYIPPTREPATEADDLGSDQADDMPL